MIATKFEQDYRDWIRHMSREAIGKISALPFDEEERGKLTVAAAEP